ncbi:unnamed protein product, partial [Amoebophrya sp. A120]
ARQQGSEGAGADAAQVESERSAPPRRASVIVRHLSTKFDAEAFEKAIEKSLQKQSPQQAPESLAYCCTLKGPKTTSRKQESGGQHLHQQREQPFSPLASPAGAAGLPGSYLQPRSSVILQVLHFNQWSYKTFGFLLQKLHSSFSTTGFFNTISGYRQVFSDHQGDFITSLADAGVKRLAVEVRGNTYKHDFSAETTLEMHAGRMYTPQMQNVIN